MKLNPQAQKVLVFLSDEYSAEMGCYCFASIMSETGIEDRATVRRACRLLTRKGLARYERCLWSDDGEPRGAGYGGTKAGVEFCKDWPRNCENCGKNLSDPPSRLCPGCEAYQEHQH